MQDKGVLLTTYDIVRTSSKSLRGDSYLHDDESEDNTIWDYIILDEVVLLIYCQLFIFKFNAFHAIIFANDFLLKLYYDSL